VNAIHLTPAGPIREPIDVDLAELERRVVLAYTGAPRNSGINNWQVTKLHIDGDRRVIRNFDRIAAIAVAMRGALERNRWNEVGDLLAEEWAHRRRNCPTITTPFIDRLVRAAGRKGGVAAKVCGAGGGGCVLFFVKKDAKEEIAQEITRLGAQVLPVRIVPTGVEVQG
jgi:D-glycero-alpha-D-manno-heptose-7-phosphate kinase